MAVIPFEKQVWNGDGDVYKVVGLATGDESSALTFPEGSVDVNVHIYGTVGGSTVAVKGSFLNVQFDTVDDAYGSAMSYTALGVVKPIGPALSALKVVVTGGAGVAVTADVKVVRRIRP